ncbi:helix-turn-helix domain-containing protein [Galbibacter sp. EGI 63066]|uniref:helix-turn-helix domain-containing protein n=1 Tax=Galbibacter sp. EGI 63066 TaxID=2993559 RepID=UPI00224897A5|nr:helix-turn-helix domain-containing protein [Galbibacter sp. EGI 63066]MCX2680024.1 helix-turn-helix domain-containing protein [Galbibacter sp. EGI 63066]
MVQNNFVASKKHNNMMLNSKSIGNKIAVARKKINLSQSELAKHVSISPQAVGKWERGESMPDITTLNRLAEILGVDLNYFSDGFQTVDVETTKYETYNTQTVENPISKPNKNFDWNWNMSQGNWVDADFSGLKNLTEKFSSSNMKNCKFMNADLSGLILGKNNIELCDFSSSNIRNSKIQSSNLLNNQFNNCSFIDAVFLKNNIGKCNFSEADFSGAEIIEGYFESNIVKNVVWKLTSFKNTGISDVVFEGNFEDCQFENCAFYNVKFQNATILNTFFKYNRKFKKVQFINCRVDKITYAFLKNNQANLTGITVLE